MNWRRQRKMRRPVIEVQSLKRPAIRRISLFSITLPRMFSFVACSMA